jgi:hypothetical protein
MILLIITLISIYHSNIRSELILDLFENPVGSLTSPPKNADFVKKSMFFVVFLAVVVRKLKFPSNSIIMQAV